MEQYNIKEETLAKPRIDHEIRRRPKGKFKLQKKLWASVLRQPYLVVNSLAIITATVLVFAMLGSTNLRMGLLSGEVTSLTLAMIACIALLGSSVSLAFLSERERASKRHEELLQRFSAIEQVEQAIHLRIREYSAHRSEHNDGPHFIRKDASSIWGSLAAGSEFVTLNSYAWKEVTLQRDSDGSQSFVVDVDRIKAWLPRFSGSTKLSQVSHIFAVNPDEEVRTSGVPPAMMRLLGAYVALEKVAGDAQQRLDLSTVKFYLYQGEFSAMNSVQIGVHENNHDRDRPFICRDTDTAPVSFGVRLNGLMNNLVEVSYDQVEIEAGRAALDELKIRSNRLLTLKDAVIAFGHMVPTINYRRAGHARHLDVPSEPENGTLDFGDGSFQINNGMTAERSIEGIREELRELANKPVDDAIEEIDLATASKNAMQFFAKKDGGVAEVIDFGSGSFTVN